MRETRYSKLEVLCLCKWFLHWRCLIKFLKVPFHLCGLIFYSFHMKLGLFGWHHLEQTLQKDLGMKEYVV